MSKSRGLLWACVVIWLGACASDGLDPGTDASATPDASADVAGAADSASAADATGAADAPAPADASADGSAAADAVTGTDGSAATDAGTRDGGPRFAQTAECLQCTQDVLANGSEMVKKSCPPQIGCEGLAASDRVLCEALLDCMLASKCWDDATGAAKCLCGTAQGLACTTAANGACRNEIMAATDSSDYVQAAARLYNTRDYPASGNPAKRFTCQIQGGCRDKCTAVVPAF
jgi:hypothetical protein